MIRLDPFELEAPATFDELQDVLAHRGDETRILAGGTDMIVNMKHGIIAPKCVVWPGKLMELREISGSPASGLEIGAMCTLDDIARSALVKQSCPTLVRAVMTIGSPAIRNAATLGGNICLDTRCYFYDQSEFWRAALGGCMKLNISGNGGQDVCHAAPGLKRCSAVFCSDLAPLLIALDATITIVGFHRKRSIPLMQLYQNDGMNHLTIRPGEIVTRVIIPHPEAGQRSCHKKVRLRESIDFPFANVGVSLRMDSNNICRNLRIVIGAIHSAPVQALSAQAILEGHEPTPDRVKASAAEASTGVKPLPNLLATAGFRKRMVTTLVEQALNELTALSSGRTNNHGEGT